LSFLHDVAFFKLTEDSSDFVVAGEDDKVHAILLTFYDKLVLSTHACPLDLHEESGFESELLEE